MIMIIKKRLQRLLISRLFIFGALLFLVLPSTAIASEIAIEVFTDKTSITMKDRLVLTVKISGEVIGSLPEPYELSYDGFDVMRRPSTSSNFSWVNGRISSSKTITYILMPKSEGSFLVGRASIDYKGDIYTSKPVEVKVAAAAPVANEEDMSGETTTMMADPLARILVSAALVDQPLGRQFLESACLDNIGEGKRGEESAQELRAPGQSLIDTQPVYIGKN